MFPETRIGSAYLRATCVFKGKKKIQNEKIKLHLVTLLSVKYKRKKEKEPKSYNFNEVENMAGPSRLNSSMVCLQRLYMSTAFSVGQKEHPNSITPS